MVAPIIRGRVRRLVFFRLIAVGLALLPKLRRIF
jgi:hypothetical protein